MLSQLPEKIALSTSSTSRLAERRRHLIKSGGKQLLRKLGEFQARHSLVSTTPFLSRSDFPGAESLEGSVMQIRSELQAVMQKPEDIPAFHQLSEDQARISKGDNWKVFTFYVFGKRVEENCLLCPNTAAALAQIEHLQNAFFSILAPGYHIPPHKGPTRAIIRVHLPLFVPADRERCWIRVHDEYAFWKDGECMVFDDSYEHEVHNETDEVRVVLFLDFDRPMDRFGTAVNNLIVKALRASSYVSRPLDNLAKWNTQRRNS